MTFAAARISRICARIIAELFCATSPAILAGSQFLGWFGSRASRALDVYDIHRITAPADVHTVHPNPNSVRDAAAAANAEGA